MSFADVEARVNASVFKKLANAVATPAIGSPFDIVFDAAGSVVDDLGVVVQTPMFEVPTVAVASLSDGSDLTIGGAPYRVRQKLPLDEGLRTRVILAEA